MMQDMLSDDVPVANALFLAGEVSQINSRHLLQHKVLPHYVFVGMQADGVMIRYAFSEDETPDIAEHVSFMINEQGCLDPIAVFAVGACLASYTALEARESGWI